MPPLPKLVFLHGLFETPDLWLPSLARLGLTEDSALCPSLPGHSSADTAGSTEADLASGAWLDRMVNAIAAFSGGEPCILVGHSTGGMIAAMIARAAPGLVHSIVMAGSLTCGHRGLKATASMRLMANGVLGPLAFRAGWAWSLSSQAVFAEQLRGVMAQGDPLDIPDTMRQTLQQCDAGAIRSMALWVLAQSVATGMAEIEVPVLAMIGQSDTVVPPQHQFGILRHHPMSQGVLMAGGHLPFVENPEQFDRTLLQWILTTSAPVRAARLPQQQRRRVVAVPA